MTIDPLNPVTHFDAAQRLSKRMGAGEGDVAGPVSSVVAAADPYVQMRANPLLTKESIEPGDPGASVRADFSPAVERAKKSAAMRLERADAHVGQPTVSDRSQSLGQATVEQFENNVQRKQRLESAMDIRQATSGRLGALHLAEQRPDAAPVAVAMASYKASPAGPEARRVEAVSAGATTRSYGHEAAASKYKRVSKNGDSSSILAGAPNLEAVDEFDSVAGVAIPRVGILK